MLTHKGIAYVKQDRPKYKPWYEVIQITKLPIYLYTKKVNPRYFTIVRDKDHESKEGYKERKKKLFPIIVQIYVNALKKRLEEIKVHPEICTKKELKKQLNKLPKRLSKYSKWLEKYKKKNKVMMH